MVLLDASSSMLNITTARARRPGIGGLDQARDALAGDASLFDVILNNNNPVEDLVHLGLAVFGHNAPEEQKLIVQYGPCRKDNFAWALDRPPLRGPGCTDPTASRDHLDVQGRLHGRSDVRRQDLSHMPKCD
jgi:hypothetical protein